MKDECLDLTRYVLEQEFAVASDESETHRTAIISIIRDAPPVQFERQMWSFQRRPTAFLHCDRLLFGRTRQQRKDVVTGQRLWHVDRPLAANNRRVLRQSD